MIIAFINCSKTKKPYQCKAEEMYSDSHLFYLSKQYAEKLKVDDIFILSCKYGLLNREDIIEPYNETLAGSKKQKQIEYGERVYKQLIEQKWFDKVRQIHFITSEPYHWRLIELLEPYNIPIVVHTKGLGMGYKIQFLKTQISRQKKLF